MRTDRRALAFLLASAVAVSGCSGTDATGVAATPDPASDESFREGQTGILRVVVTDDSLSPLSGATVGVLESKVTAETNEAGSATLGPLDPGTYTAVAQKLGYQSDAKKFDVAAGGTVDLTLRLAPIPTVEPYHNTLIFRGHITCGAGLIQVRLITVCGTTGTGTAAGNVTVDPNHKDEFRQTGLPGLQTLIGELVWASSAALTAKEFTLGLYQNWRCTPFCSSDNNYGSTNGKSPVVHRAEGPFAGLKKGPATISHVVGLPGQSADPPYVIFVIQQDYNIYSTHFFGAPAPERFSANPDK